MRRGSHVTDYDRGSGVRVAQFSGIYQSSTHGRLTSAERRALPDSAFAVITAEGERKYPIPDENHARNALARVARFGSPHEKRLVCEKVAKKFPEIHETHCGMHSDGKYRVKIREDHQTVYSRSYGHAAALRAERSTPGAVGIVET